MATMREGLARLLGLRPAPPGPPVYIWMKKTPDSHFMRLKRRRNGLYESDDRKDFIKLVISGVLEAMHKAGREMTFYDGVGYYFTNDPHKDPNGMENASPADPLGSYANLKSRLMPEGEFEQGAALLRQVDAMNHVEQGKASREPKSLLQ